MQLRVIKHSFAHAEVRETLHFRGESTGSVQFEAPLTAVIQTATDTSSRRPVVRPASAGSRLLLQQHPGE